MTMTITDRNGTRVYESEEQTVRVASEPKHPQWPWNMITDLPVIRSWRAANDAAFLLTSLPMGLTYFVVGIVGLALGIPLTFLGVGFAILAGMVGTLLVIGRFERARLNVFLNAGIDEPRRWESTHGSLIQRLKAYASDRQLWSEGLYAVLLFPIGIIEFTIVGWPLEYLLSPITAMLFGEANPGFGAFAVNNPVEALIAFGIGIILIVPVLFLANIVAVLHKQLGRRLLG